MRVMDPSRRVDPSVNRPSWANPSRVGDAKPEVSQGREMAQLPAYRDNSQGTEGPSHVRHTAIRRWGAMIAAVIVTGFAASPARAASSETIVQFKPGVTAATARATVTAAGARVTRDLHIINAVGALVGDDAARRLAADPAVVRVTAAAPVRSTATTLVNTSGLGTSYNASVFADKLWNSNGLTGKGVGVAVIDTGVAGDLPDFRT